MSLQPIFNMQNTMEPVRDPQHVEANSMKSKALDLALVERDLASPFIIPQTATMPESPHDDDTIHRQDSTKDNGSETVAIEQAEQPAAGNRVMKRRTSIWGLFKRDTPAEQPFAEVKTPAKPVEGAVSISSQQKEEPVVSAEKKQDEGVGEGGHHQPDSERDVAVQVEGEEQAQELPANQKSLKRRSSSIFSMMPWYTNRVRRETESEESKEEDVGDDGSKEGVQCKEKAVKGARPLSFTMESDQQSQRKIQTAHMPSRSATLNVQVAMVTNGKRIAEDMVRFAHARHLIKITDNIETVRSVAFDLEDAFRQQVDKVSFLHAQYEAMSWRLHDLSDENKHLRTQLGKLSEQIVLAQHENTQIKERMELAGKQSECKETLASTRPAASVAESATSDDLYDELKSVKLSERCTDDNVCTVQSPEPTVLFSANFLSPRPIDP